MTTYVVRRDDFGIVVIGLVPLNEILKLMRAWQAEGYDWCDRLVAEHFKASIAVCKKGDSDRWREALGIRV